MASAGILLAVEENGAIHFGLVEIGFDLQGLAIFRQRLGILVQIGVGQGQG